MKPEIAVLGPHGQKLQHHGLAISAISLHEAYADAVVQSGGIPVIIPPLEDEADLANLLRQCDGILLPGGEDVGPEFYAEAPSEKIGVINHRYDWSWITAVSYAVPKKMPMLGICRGMQLVNVALGGSLYQDLSEVPGAHILHSQQQERSDPTHSVAICESSNLAHILGKTIVDVNSMHHQCVKRLGKGLKAVARATDGVVEGLEDETGSGLLQLVQWHPEELLQTVPCMKNLFSNLAEQANIYAWKQKTE